MFKTIHAEFEMSWRSPLYLRLTSLFSILFFQQFCFPAVLCFEVKLYCWEMQCKATKHLLPKWRKNNYGLQDNREDNNRSDTMRHFHEMSQPFIVNTTERMFGGCEDMDACWPGSHKAKQLEEDAFFNKDILCTQSCHVIDHFERADSY